MKDSRDPAALPPSHAAAPRGRRLAHGLVGAAAVALLLLLGQLYQLTTAPAPWPRDRLRGILGDAQYARFQADVHKCAAFARLPYWERERVDPKQRRVNPRFTAKAGEASTTVLKNAVVFDGEKWLGKNDIVIQQGVIAEVVPEVAASFLAREDVEVVNMDLRYIVPGLIDMHSHSGVDSYPALKGTDDTNEMTAPLTPYSRALDAINPHDPAHGLIASGGVTTSLIIPGSGNVMGGEGVAIKNKYQPANTIEAMLLEPTAAANRTRWMKMACGENPKRVHKDLARTRMGLSHVLRAHMAKAAELKAAQDDWCELATAAEPTARRRAAVMGLPEDLELEFTVAMLRGDVRVNIHCYETMDLEAMLRHAGEFGYRVAAFHHAIDSYRVPELLAGQGYNITQAMFAEHGLYKKEGYQVSLHAGRILADAGVPVAYKSDHPVSFAKHLIVQAAIAHTFDLPQELALAAVTSVPARALGLDDRIGYVREGYDADLAVWNMHPLKVGATPLQVYIDGEKLYNYTEPALPPAAADAAPPPQRAVFTPEQTAAVCDALKATDDPAGVLVVTGIRSSSLPAHLAAAADGDSLTLVMRNNTIACLSAACELPAGSTHRTIALRDGHVTPGLIAVGPSLGLSEIQAEGSTRDGSTADVSATDPAHLVFAKYGAHFGSKTLARAASAGITRVVTPPLHGGGVLRGISTALDPAGHSPLDGIVQGDVALHVVVGQDAKGTTYPTISAQVAALRELLNGTAATTSGGYFARAAAGALPVVVHAHNRDDIAQLVLLQRELPAVRLVVLGGAEAWDVAGALAAARIPVILAPWRCAPEAWEARRCLAGPPATASPLQVLVDAGVTVGIAVAEDDLVRDLPMELAWAARVLGVGRDAAWRLGSANLAAMLQLEEGEGEGAAGVVLWEGDPLEGAGVVVATLDGRGGARCLPPVE